MEKVTFEPMKKEWEVDMLRSSIFALETFEKVLVETTFNKEEEMHKELMEKGKLKLNDYTDISISEKDGIYRVLVSSGICGAGGDFVFYFPYKPDFMDILKETIALRKAYERKVELMEN